MQKHIRYRLYGIIDIEADNPDELTDILERIKEVGDAEVVGVELVEPNAKLSNLQEDFWQLKKA